MTPQEPQPTQAAAPEAAPAESGQAPAEHAEAAPAPATPEGPSISFEVDGEQVTVSQADAPQHFLRQADYTRKTQALAEQREALADAEALRVALEADPAATIQVLQDAYGLTPQQAQAAAAQQQEPLDPEEERWQRVEGFMQQTQQTQMQQQVEYELQQVEAQAEQLGLPKVGRSELIAHAIQNEIPNLGAAYRDMIFDQVRQQQAEQQSQQDQAIQQQKAAAAFVEGGHSAQAGTVVAGGGEQVDGVRAAYNLAKRQHGLA